MQTYASSIKAELDEKYLCKKINAVIITAFITLTVGYFLGHIVAHFASISNASFYISNY